jgi:glucokinase
MPTIPSGTPDTGGPAPLRSVGLDLGGTKCLAVAVEHDQVVGELRVPTPPGTAALLDALANAARRLVDERGVVGVGLGAPGLVDRDGVLQFAPNLRGVGERLPLKAELEARLGVMVRVDNDATCAAWGERQMGAARGYDDVVMVTLGTGIGGGIVVDGRLARGAHGFAGEIGHMILDPDGPPCPCGQRGCWERYASGSGLGRLGREAAVAGTADRVVELAGGDPELVRGEHVSRAASDGDPGGLAVLHHFARWVAVGLVNLANIFDPEAFVLGGGLVEMGDLLLAPVAASFAELLTSQAHRPSVAILPATLGERAGAIGAARLLDNLREIEPSSPL